MQRALLLTDVVDSTRLADSLGDVAMAAVWAAHDRLARDLLAVHRGLEIDKTDGFLLLFERASDAVAYALGYHRALRSLNPPIHARAGLHVGPVILTKNAPEDVARGAKPLEVDGLAKPTAARVMALAMGGQTLLTPAAMDDLGPTPLRVLSHGHWQMKGVHDPTELFEVGDEDAPFQQPPDNAKVHRVVRHGDRWLPVPRPSDDALITGVGLTGALLSAALFSAYAWNVQRPAIVASGPTTAMDGWLMALVAALVPFAAGAVVAALSRGSPRNAAAWAGLWTATGGWALAGAGLANVETSRDWLSNGLTGGQGLSELAAATGLGGPVITAAWITWGGLMLAPVLGYPAGLLGSELGLPFRRRAAVRVVPNDGLRRTVLGASMAVALLLSVVLTAAITSLRQSLSEVLEKAASVGSDLLILGPDLPLLTIGIQVLLTNWVAWPALVRQWNRGAVRERVSAAATAAIVLVGTALTCAVLLTNASDLVRVGGGAGAVAAFGGLSWAVGSGRLQPPEAEVDIGSREAWLGAFTAFALAAIVLAAPAICYGTTAALLLVPVIEPVQLGLPLDAALLDHNLWLLWRIQWLLGLLTCVAGMGTATVTVGATMALSGERPGWGALIAVAATSAMVFATASFGNATAGREAPPRPEVAWPNARDLDQSSPDTTARSYLEAVPELLHASPGRALEDLEHTDAIWLEAAVVRSLLRELDGVPMDAAWRDTRVLSADGAGWLAEAVRVWPDGSDPIFHDDPERLADPLGQLLHAWLLARHLPAADAGDASASMALTLHGRRAELPYLLAAWTEVGPGIPSERELLAADLWFDEAQSWTGRPTATARAARVWLSLRADQTRLAREMTRELNDVDLQDDLLAATVLDVALRLGDATQATRARAALDQLPEPTDRRPRPHIRLAAAIRAVGAYACAGRFDASQALLDEQFTLAVQQDRPLDARTLANLDRELAAATGRVGTLWDRVEPAEAPWPPDDCARSAMAALEGDSEAREEALARCDHAGAHCVWRNALAP